MNYVFIKRFQLSERPWGDLDFFEFYCENLVEPSFYKQLFPKIFHSFAFTSSTGFIGEQYVFDSKGTYKKTSVFSYGIYFLKDIEHEKFTLLDSISFLKQFENYRNEMHDDFVYVPSGLPPDAIVTNDNALKFMQETITIDCQFIDVYQYIRKDAPRAPTSFPYDYFKCFIGFDWKRKRVYRIEISTD